jgi:hypothetical protein
MKFHVGYMGSTSNSCSFMVVKEKMKHSFKGLQLLVRVPCHMVIFVTNCIMIFVLNILLVCVYCVFIVT